MLWHIDVAELYSVSIKSLVSMSKLLFQQEIYSVKAPQFIMYNSLEFEPGYFRLWSLTLREVIAFLMPSAHFIGSEPRTKTIVYSSIQHELALPKIFQIHCAFVKLMLGCLPTNFFLSLTKFLLQSFSHSPLAVMWLLRW